MLQIAPPRMEAPVQGIEIPTSAAGMGGIREVVAFLRRAQRIVALFAGVALSPGPRSGSESSLGSPGALIAPVHDKPTTDATTETAQLTLATPSIDCIPSVAVRVRFGAATA